jgi:ketosteroid isomerase-like protein
MLALIHPDVVWHPLTRPGRSTYNGHEGTLQMLADYAKALGPYWMDWTELSELPDGSVHARGRVIRETDDGEVADPPVEAVIRLRDGLFASLDSNTSTDN